MALAVAGVAPVAPSPEAAWPTRCPGFFQADLGSLVSFKKKKQPIST